MTWRFLRARRLRLAAVSLCVLPLVAFLVAWWLSPRYLEVSQLPEKADVIVVLGTGESPRLPWAAQLYGQGYAPQVLLSGYRNYPPADNFARDHGIPAANVIVERDSTTTYTNATYAAPILRTLGARKVVLVTSWYHSRRALQTFRHVMPDIRFISVPAPRGTDPRDRQSAKDEFWKLCYYALAHGVSPL